MKDFIGQEINPGDIVAWTQTQGGGTAQLELRKVLKVGDKKVSLKPIFESDRASHVGAHKLIVVNMNIDKMKEL